MLQSDRHSMEYIATAPPSPHSPPATSLTHALHLWHLLSLDAPTVATLWTWFVARTAHVSLTASTLISMFLAVWMLYVADRILDARHLFSDPLHTDDLEARHLFHHRHATAFLTAILASSIALAILLPHLFPEALRLDVILAALLSGWFLLIHARALPFTSANRRLPKELAVGIFFPAAIFIPTIARRPDLRLTLLLYALLFAAVCTLNCLSIYAWEHPQPHTSAHWTTRLSTRHLRALATTIALAGLALTAISIDTHITPWPLALAASLSALGLLALDRNRRHLTPLTLRALADLVLLTPLLFIPFFG
jgi:membrane protein YdbS with pleckstrin-like domain